MRNLIGRVAHVGSPASLALALLCFLLPFASVSCDAPGGYGRMEQGGTTSYTGLDLAVGSAPNVDADHLRPTDAQQPDDLGVQPLVLIAALSVVAALGASLVLRRRALAALLATGAAVALAIGLLLARSTLVDRVGDQATEPFPDGRSASDYVGVEAGFWLSTGLLVIGAGLAMVDDGRGAAARRRAERDGLLTTPSG